MTYIDCDELAVRIGEAIMRNHRPKHMTARQAFEDIKRMNPDAAADFMSAGRAVADYIAECCNTNNPGQVEVASIADNNGGTQ